MGFEASLSLPARPSDQYILETKWNVGALRISGDVKRGDAVHGRRKKMNIRGKICVLI